MSRFLLVCLSAALFFFHPRSQTPSGRTALDSLVASERAFARMSVEKGVRESFLRFFADDGIVFRPNPVNYKESVRNQPAPSDPHAVTLDWEPIVADIASSGDLGYTTGPFINTDNGPEHRAPQHGFFFSVWRKQRDGEWRVVLDFGIRTPAPYEGPREIQYPGGERVSPHYTSKGIAPERKELLTTEESLNTSVKQKGLLKGFHNFLGATVRLYRPGFRPLLEKDSIRLFLSGIAHQVWRPMFSDVSQSADLGYTYGSYEIRNENDSLKEKGCFARVWKRNPENVWKIVLDVSNVLPKE